MVKHWKQFIPCYRYPHDHQLSQPLHHLDIWRHVPIWTPMETAVHSAVINHFASTAERSAVMTALGDPKKSRPWSTILERQGWDHGWKDSPWWRPLCQQQSSKVYIFIFDRATKKVSPDDFFADNFATLFHAIWRHAPFSFFHDLCKLSTAGGIPGLSNQSINADFEFGFIFSETERYILWNFCFNNACSNHVTHNNLVCKKNIFFGLVVDSHAWIQKNVFHSFKSHCCTCSWPDVDFWSLNP